MGDQPMLVDSGDQLGDEGLMPLVLVDAGDAQKDDGNVSVPVPKDGLGSGLGLRTNSARIDRRILVDALVRAVGRPVNEHRARISSTRSRQLPG